jgi:hypothetical protein
MTIVTWAIKPTPTKAIMDPATWTILATVTLHACYHMSNHDYRHLSNHGAIIDTEAHVCCKEFGAPFLAHDLHHFLDTRDCYQIM